MGSIPAPTSQRNKATVSWAGLQHFGFSSLAAPALAGEVLAPDCCLGVIPGPLQPAAQASLLLQPLIL